MATFLERNRKRMVGLFMIGLMVFLMIVFIIPPDITRGIGGGGNPILGHLGDRELRASEVQSAYNQVQVLAHMLMIRNPRPQPGQDPFIPLLDVFFGVHARTIENEPELYHLLLLEAEQMGSTVSQQQVEQLLDEEIYVQLPGSARSPGPIVEFSQVRDPRTIRQVRTTLSNLMRVQQALARAQSVIKITQPLRHNEIARNWQALRLRVVELPVHPFLLETPEPTTEQMAEHFQAFAEVLPGTVDEQNPFGFGYRFPDRVMLQYIAVSRDDVRKVVQASRSDYEWTVEAQKYYQRNPGEFQASTQPAVDQFSLNPSPQTMTPSETQPTIKPFEQVRDQIVERVMRPEIDRLLQNILTRISAVLNSDYLVWSEKDRQAPTSLGVTYDSYEYLQRLAEQIQSDFRVLPSTASLQDRLMTIEQLRELPGIGQAMVVQGPMQFQADFARYVQEVAEPFVDERSRRQPSVLSLYEPSVQLRDPRQNTYIFRLTAAQPSSPPQSLEEVAEQVRIDLRRKLAFERARNHAVQIAEKARQMGLETATDRPVQTIGPVRAQSPVPELALPPEATESFTRQAFDLLAQIDPDDPQRRIVGLIELPRQDSILVAELIAVESELNEEGLLFAEMMIADRAVQELSAVLLRDWFDPQAIRQRLNYRPREFSPQPAEPRPEPMRRPLL